MHAPRAARSHDELVGHTALLTLPTSIITQLRRGSQCGPRATGEGRGRLGFEEWAVRDIRRPGSAGSRPDAEPAAPRSPILRLQRAAGNRAVARMLQRASGDPRTESVGEFYVKRATPGELRQDTAAIVSDLEAPGLDPARRATEEQNLETFETFAAAHHMALPAATAHHLRQVAMTLAGDAQAINGVQRELYDDIGESTIPTQRPSGAELRR
jgi:hypothetical protein